MKDQESSTTSRGALQSWQQAHQPGYVFDEQKRRWVVDTSDGLRICKRCNIRLPLDHFTGNKQKAHTCKTCRRYQKAMSRYGISYERAKQLYMTIYCACCGIEFDDSKHQQCIHR